LLSDKGDETADGHASHQEVLYQKRRSILAREGITVPSATMKFARQHGMLWHMQLFWQWSGVTLDMPAALRWL
jgi:uncharacterized membrane protein